MNSDPNGIQCADDKPASQHSVPSSARKFGWWRLASVFGALLFLASFMWWHHSLDMDLRNARQSVSRGSWERAVTSLNRYLRYRPDDAEAHLLAAEAHIRSGGSNASENVQRAIFHLQQISSDSELAAKARLQEGRVSLLLMKKPGVAERLVKESLKLNADSIEANLLMWQLLDVTGRHVLSDTYFWKAFELSLPPDRGLLLADWYLSEFYPEQLHADLFRQMGVSMVGKIPASINLLVQFREVEPDADFLHAALAKYYHDVGNVTASMDLLKECPDISVAMSDPFFVSVLFEALIDLGQFQKAESCFQEFPQPRDGYFFWRSESMYHDYVRNDSVAAVNSLRKALAFAPARYDWGLMTRLSVCLKKTGAIEDSDNMQKQVDHLTRDVLTVENTSLLRNLLRAPQRPEVAAKFVDFYTEFGLEREVSAWNDYKQFLENQQTASDK